MDYYAHLVSQFLFSFVATVGFSIFFNAPKKSLMPCGLIGGIGWTTYIVLTDYTESVLFSIVIASGLISLLSEILARKLKYPAINFIIPGILPLVPGLGLYNMMYEFVYKNYDTATVVGSEALMKSAGIAIGILIVTSFTKTYYILLAKFKENGVVFKLKK